MKTLENMRSTITLLWDKLQNTFEEVEEKNAVINRLKYDMEANEKELVSKVEFHMTQKRKLITALYSKLGVQGQIEIQEDDEKSNLT